MEPRVQTAPVAAAPGSPAQITDLPGSPAPAANVPESSRAAQIALAVCLVLLVGLLAYRGYGNRLGVRPTETVTARFDLNRAERSDLEGRLIERERRLETVRDEGARHRFTVSRSRVPLSSDRHEADVPFRYE